MTSLDLERRSEMSDVLRMRVGVSDRLVGELFLPGEAEAIEPDLTGHEPCKTPKRSAKHKLVIDVAPSLRISRALLR